MYTTRIYGYTDQLPNTRINFRTLLKFGTEVYGWIMPTPFFKSTILRIWTPYAQEHNSSQRLFCFPLLFINMIIWNFRRSKSRRQLSHLILGMLWYWSHDVVVDFAIALILQCFHQSNTCCNNQSSSCSTHIWNLTHCIMISIVETWIEGLLW